MPKKKQTGMVGRCGDAASRLADCRWKKERQKKLNKEVDAMEAKAKIYELKAKAKEAKDKAAKKKLVKPKKPNPKPTKVTKPKVSQKSGSDAKRLRDAGRRVPKGKGGAKTDTTLFNN